MAITKIQSNAFPATIDLSNIDLTIGAGEILTDNIADTNVTHAKLHTDMDLTSKTVVLPTLSQNLSIEKSANPAFSVIETGAGAVTIQGTGSGGRVYSNSGNKLLLGANGQNSHLNIDTAGHVGIGTTNPDRPLHVTRGDGTGTVIKVGNTGTSNATIEFVDTGTTDTISIGSVGNDLFLKSDDGDIVFATTGDPGTASMTVKRGGNVGIGTTSPEATLHATGYRDGQGNGVNDTTLMLSSTSTAAGSNTANGPESLKFKGYGHNYNGDVTGIAGSNEINFELSPTWKYWGEDNSLSPYGQSHPVMDFKTKGSNETAASNILRMMGYGKRLVGTMYNGSTDVNRQMTKGAVNLLPQLGRYIGSVGGASTGYLADMLGTGSNTKGVYLVFINGGGNANARDTGIYLVTYSSATDIYDSGLLVTEQISNKGLNVQAVNASGNIDHRFFSITTLMQGYDTCYGNCGSFNLDANGTITTGGAYGGCSVWAIHLGGEDRGGRTLWES
jgi:hypothetical protein